MDDAQAMNLAVDAAKDLQQLRIDVSDIKQLILNDGTEVLLPGDVEDMPEVQALDLDPVETVEAVEDVKYNEQMQMLWASNALLVSILCVLLVSLGVQLWQCFSDKWRS